MLVRLSLTVDNAYLDRDIWGVETSSVKLAFSDLQQHRWAQSAY